MCFHYFNRINNFLIVNYTIGIFWFLNDIFPFKKKSVAWFDLHCRSEQPRCTSVQSVLIFLSSLAPDSAAREVRVWFFQLCRLGQARSPPLILLQSWCALILRLKLVPPAPASNLFPGKCCGPCGETSGTERGKVGGTHFCLWILLQGTTASVGAELGRTLSSSRAQPWSRVSLPRSGFPGTCDQHLCLQERSSKLQERRRAMVYSPPMI